MTGEIRQERLDAGNERGPGRYQWEGADITQEVTRQNKKRKRESKSSSLSDMRTQVNALEGELAAILNSLPSEQREPYAAFLSDVKKRQDINRAWGEETFNYVDNNEPPPLKPSKEYLKNKMMETELAVDEVLEIKSKENIQKAQKLIIEARKLNKDWEIYKVYKTKRAREERGKTPESPRLQEDVYLVRYTHYFSSGSESSEVDQ